MKNGLHIDSNGTKRWFKDDKLHRTDGPAVERDDGVKVWWVDGRLHRVDGPAAEYSDGSKEWYKNGESLGDDDSGFWALWDRLTEEQRNNLNLHMHLPGIVK